MQRLRARNMSVVDKYVDPDTLNDLGNKHRRMNADLPLDRDQYTTKQRQLGRIYG